jgi:hypothetical protein
VNREGRRYQGSPPSVDTGKDVKLKNPVSSRCLLACALTLAFLLAPLRPAAAETFLIAVTETDDGEPSQPPLAAREGILAALFDGDHIAFEVPAGNPPMGTEALRTLAVEAGAGTVAVIVVDWHPEHISGGALRVSGRGSIVLIDARTGRQTDSLPFAVGNEGREGIADRSRLGVEIGLALIEAFRASSAGR